ncbi:MAG: hypothetical protein KGN79_06250 [Acidobacteriota bacterium]|nr:hypothetical protein [Acidobacteriota bacterium]
MKRRTRLNFSSIIMMLGALLLAVGPVAQRAWAGPDDDNANVNNLLDQAQYQAERLARDTNAMTGQIRSDVSWQALSDQLVRERAHVNDLGKLIHQLQSSRIDASRWQKESIDRVVPLLQDVANDTTDQIEYLNKHESSFYAPRFHKWANQNAKLSHEFAGMVTDIVQYGKDRAELARLRDNLDQPNIASK